MLNLTGQTLSVSLPISVLEKMGHIEGTEAIEEYFRKMADRVSDVITKQQKLQMEKSLPYLPNAAFVPVVINNMLEHDLSFFEALSISDDDIKVTAFSASLKLSMIKFIPEISNAVESFMDVLPDFVSNASHSDHLSDMFNCTIPKISESFWDELVSLGITGISEKILNMSKVSDVIETKLITPLLAVTFKTLLQNKGISEDELTDEDKAFFEENINEMVFSFKNVFVVQTVLSEVLTKAIDERITAADAIDSFKENELIELVVEKLVFSDDLSKYAEQLEKAIAIVSTIMG